MLKRSGENGLRMAMEHFWSRYHIQTVEFLMFMFSLSGLLTTDEKLINVFLKINHANKNISRKST